MNRLKSKASRYFHDSLTQDEKVASRFFRTQNEKPLPSPPYTAPCGVAPPPLLKDCGLDGCVDATVNPSTGTASAETEKPLPPRPASQNPDEESSASRKTKQADPVLKKRPSFASLRKSSSRIFRSNTGDHPPPPPMPQIPIDTPTPKPRRPTLRPFEPVRSARSSASSQGRITSISRPISSTQVSQRAANSNPHTVPVTKPSGPPPPRPARPEGVDEDLVALARDGGARTVLHTPPTARPLTTSTTPSARSSDLSQTSSEEAYARLGLPSGHSPPSRASPALLTPFAATRPAHLTQPLDSSASVKSYGSFRAYLNAHQRYASGAYDDGVGAGEREMGPVEMYRASKCADWTLERRVSGKLGERGMLFRDRWGGWHLVVDI